MGVELKVDKVRTIIIALGSKHKKVICRRCEEDEGGGNSLRTNVKTLGEEASAVALATSIVASEKASSPYNPELFGMLSCGQVEWNVVRPRS
ncbi:unnamed protein product [Allacma fusca]|uniref:Uncharacterized protein n=1 Tax=Allacma fusca TaxID=39272 RepID=A0A8J2KM25_9HEXA|nr:unnamed protein product [Allacma fusca]